MPGSNSLSEPVQKTQKNQTGIKTQADNTIQMATERKQYKLD